MPEKAPHWRLAFLFILLVIVPVFFLRDTYWQTALSEREFVKVYVEVVKLQTRFPNQPLKARAETKKMLDNAGVTEEQVNRFIERVSVKPEKWAEIWEKINKELERDATLPKNR